MGLLENRPIAERLLQFRTQVAKLSGRQFALKAGINPGQYQRIEKAHLPLSKNILKNLLAFYPQMDRDYIVLGIQQKDGVSKIITPEDAELERAIEAVGVAESLMKVLPAPKPYAPDAVQLKTMAERSDKLEMTVKLLFGSCNYLINYVQELRGASNEKEGK